MGKLSVTYNKTILIPHHSIKQPVSSHPLIRLLQHIVPFLKISPNVHVHCPIHDAIIITIIAMKLKIQTSISSLSKSSGLVLHSSEMLQKLTFISSIMFTVFLQNSVGRLSIKVSFPFCSIRKLLNFTSIHHIGTYCMFRRNIAFVC